MRLEIKKALVESQKSLILNLERMNVNDEEIDEIISELIDLTPNVSTINLDNNMLTDKSAVTLNHHLTSLTGLKQLGLQFNKLDKAGFASLFSLKHSLPELKLFLHGNKINNALIIKEIEQQALDDMPKKLSM